LQHAQAIERRLTFGLIAAVCMGSPCAFAQAVENVPAPAAPANPQPAATPNAAAPRFDIVEYVIDGNTVLSIPDIEEAVYPFLGEGRIATDVDKAREALEQAYKTRGFQTVQVVIPEQGVESGIIHLQVVENPVGRLRVVDSRYHSLQEIRETAPSLAEGKVVNTNEVQNDIVALNQQPDLKVTPRLKAGEVPGTVDVDLQVEDKLPLHASLELNNQYSQSTSELRAVASVSYDNLWQLGHSISLSYQIAPQHPDDAQVFSGTYLVRVPRTPLTFLAYAVKSDSDVAALAGTDVVGRGNIFGARGIINLPGSNAFYQSITAGVDHKNLTQSSITPPQSPIPRRGRKAMPVHMPVLRSISRCRSAAAAKSSICSASMR
jgi:hemolysin activation/secretion protein